MAKDVPMKKRETGLSARPHELVSEKPWNGSAARFTNAQWKRSCILHVCDGDEKSCHKLPIREPGGALSRAGVHAAASRINQVDATAEQVEAAKRALRGAYKKLGEEPPSSALSASASTSKTGPAKRRRPSFLTPRVNRQLQLRVDEHNKTFKSREQRANITMLRAVYRRGADEHRARDYSHVSREQFGLERVDQFLKLLRGDTADNPRYFQDGDLLPRRHPRLTGAKITASGESQARGPQLAFVASAAAAQQDHVLLDFVTAIATTSPTSPTRQFDLNRALVYADTRPYLLAAAEELRALVADGNSRAARSARARRQLRDRKGRWIEMGGGIRWKLRLPGFGTRISHGTVVGQNVATGKIQARLDDGRVVDVPANKVESVKATLPSAEILKSRRAADTRTSADSAAREALDRVGRAIFGEAYTGDRDMDLYDAADAEITRVNGDTSGRASVVIDGNRGRVDRADLDAIIKGVESDRSQTPEQAIARIRSTEVPTTPDEEMDADAPVLDENEVTPARAIARLPEPAGLDEINNTAGDIIKELSEQIARQPGETLSDARDGFAERFLDIADAFNEPDATVADTQSDLDRLIDDVQAFVTANDDSSNEYQVLKNFAEDVDDFKAIVGLADRGETPAEADATEEAVPELQPLLQSMANQLRDLDGDYETASEQLADLADEIAAGQVTPADAVERAAEIVESPEFPGNNNPDVSKRDAAEGQRMIADLNRASEVNVEPASRPEPAPTPEPEAAPEPAVTAENPRENWPGVAQVAQELMEEIDGDTDDPGIAELLVTAGQAEWVADPEVDDVYALKRIADGETLAIVYGAERDIEISAALYDQLDGMNTPEPEIDEQPVSERLERDMAMDDLLDNMAPFISATEAAGYEESLEPFYDRVDKFRDDGDLERFVEGILDGFMGTFTDEINRDGGDFRQLREAFINGYNKWASAHYSLLPIGDDLLDDEIDVDSEPGAIGDALIDALEGIGDTIRPDDRGRGRAENMFWSRAAADISDAVEAINNGDNARAADLIDSAAANVDRYDTEQAGMVYNELTDIAQQLRDAAAVPTPEADFGPPPEPGDARTQLAEIAQYAGFAPEDVEVISNSTSAAQRVMAVLNSPIYQGLKNSDEPLSRADAELLQVLDDLLNAQVDLPEPELPSSVQWPPPGWTYPDYEGDNPSAVTDGRGFLIARDISGDYFLKDDRVTDPNYYGMYYSDLAEAIRDRDILSEMMAHDNRSRLAAAVEVADPDLANALRSEPSAARRLQMVRDSEKVQALLARADWARRPAIGGQRDAADRARVARVINTLNTMLPRQRDITSDEYATRRDLPEHAMRDNPPAPDALPPQTPEAPAAELAPTPTATPQGTEETRQKIIGFKDRMYEYFSARGVFRRGDRNLNNALFALMDVRNALRDDNKDLYDRAVSRVSWLLERRLNARDLSQEWRDVIAEHEAAGAPTPTPTPEPEPVPTPTPEPELESVPDVEPDEDDGSPPDAVDIISQALREIGMDQVADTVDGYQAGRVSPEDAIQALRDALVWQIVDLADEDARIRLGGQVVDAINAINAVENNYADMPNANPEPVSEEDRAGMDAARERVWGNEAPADAAPNVAPPRPAGAAPENRRRYVPEGVVNDRNGQEIYAGRRVRARRDGLEGIVQRVQEDPAYARIKWDDGRVQVRSARQLEVIDVVAPAVAPEPAPPTPEPALETPEAPAAPETQSFDQMLQTARFDLVTVRGQLPNVARSLDERDRRNAGLALRDAIEAIDAMDFDEFDRASARAQYLLNRSRVDGDSDLAEQVVAAIERVRDARRQQAQAPQVLDSDLFSPEEWGPDAARPGDFAPIQPSPASWGVSRPLDGTTHPQAGNPDAAASDYKAWDDRAAEIAEAARSRASLQEFLDNPTQENAKNIFGADGTEFGNSGYQLTGLGVASWGRTVSISATIVDADGRRVGTVQRQLRKGHRPGEVEYAYNALMVIDNPDNRRTGFASAYNRWMENWYIANGIKEVHVEAALEDGALVWALNGFDFYDGSSGTRWDFANHLIRWGNQNATDARERAQMAELTRRVKAAEAAGRPDMLPLPIHFAMVGFSPGKEEWFGQELMLSLREDYSGHSWNGTKHLRPDAREYAASQAWARFSRGANKRVISGENSAQVSPDFIDAMSGMTWANDLREHFDAVSGVLARNESLAQLSPAAKRKLQVALSNAMWNTPQDDDRPYDSYVHDLYKLSSVLRKELAADYPQIDTGTLAAPLISATYRDISRDNVPGFEIRDLGGAGGVNTTFAAKHLDSGMVFYVKKDDTGLSAHNGIAAANELNADKIFAQLGFAGYGRYVENEHGRSPEDQARRDRAPKPDENIIIMPRVGDTVPLAERPKNGGRVLSQNGGALRELADPNDIVRMFLFDLATGNDDRHGGNWQAARDTNGLLHLFPIDHGLITPYSVDDVGLQIRALNGDIQRVASRQLYSIGLRDYLRSLGRDQAEIIVSDIKQELHNAIVNATSRPGFINSEWWTAAPLKLVDSIDPGKVVDILTGGR